MSRDDLNTKGVNMLNAGLLLLLITASACGVELTVVDGILNRYASLPKGMTIEGTAQGLPPLTGPRYSKENHSLVFAGGERYTLPITRREAIDLIQALEGDTRLGVSLALSGDLITYGKLSNRSPVAQGLLAGDRLICGVAFARLNWVGQVKLPGNYHPKAVKGRRRIMAVIHTNLDEFSFHLGTGKQKGVIISTGFRTTYLIIPIAKTRARDGGYLPDRGRIARNEMEDADRENLSHLNASRDDYFKLPILAKAGYYGEVASLIRYLQKRGINLAALKRELR